MLGRGVKGQPARQTLSVDSLSRVRGYWGGYRGLPGISISGRWCHSLPLMVPDGGKNFLCLLSPWLNQLLPFQS